MILKRAWVATCVVLVAAAGCDPGQDSAPGAAESTVSVVDDPLDSEREPATSAWVTGPQPQAGGSAEQTSNTVESTISAVEATNGHQTAPLAGTIDEQDAASLNACDWVTEETVELAIDGPATVIEPSRVDRNLDDRWACTWQNPIAELSVSFDRFECCMRSVEAELGRIGGYGGKQLITIAGRRGSVRRPGLWFGETPLGQYGMATVVLRPSDGTDPDEDSFHAIVEAVLRDAAAADPDVSW